ncbi:MAG: hypothetical protein H6936_07010 [Burkholderiales bacterium]|nr:hypothetical protein [Burkholderiales bacterium]
MYFSKLASRVQSPRTKLPKALLKDTRAFHPTQKNETMTKISHSTPKQSTLIWCTSATEFQSSRYQTLVTR